MLIIPVFSDPYYTEDITLDGDVYTFEFRWNYRWQSWTLTIYNKEQDVLIAGIRIVLNTDLLGVYRGRAIPPGALYAIADDGNYASIVDGDLGTRVSLVYITEDEVAAL